MNCVFVGYDQREAAAFAVAKFSIRKWLTHKRNVPVYGLVLEELISDGLYVRPTEFDERGRMIDVLSARADYDGAISTQHANARFLTPAVAGLAGHPYGWALFVDGDILVREDLGELFDSLDPRFALYCVKHDYQPAATEKMDGQVQTRYARKNWSSVMAFRLDHPSNAALTVDYVNSVPGRELHAFAWLKDEEIGALDPAWNWLVGHSDPAIDPKLIHFTSGVPDMPGYENVAFADAWRDELKAWAVHG